MFNKGMMKMKHKNTILLVDDAVVYINYLTELLKDCYNIKIALDGKTALNIVQGTNPPDLILQDIVLPDMSGYDVCKELKSNNTTKDIPIIFLTSKAEDEDLTRGFKYGGSDYLTKPINTDELLARINVHLKLVNYIEELENLTKEKNNLLRALRKTSKAGVTSHLRIYKLIKKVMLDIETT